MSASQHLSKELKEFIKSIGETKSKQEEDRIITAELGTLKPKLLEKNMPAKTLKEHLIRALYIEMLGQSASFAHIHAINLTQNKNLILKRIGYLMCSLFFTKDSDLIIMLVATVLKDLASTDFHEVVICLTSLGSIMNPTIASAIVDAVSKLVTHPTDLVRKKAILVLQKIRLGTGSEVLEFKEKMKKALCDKEPCVMAASLNLYLEEIRKNPREYRNLASYFVVILKQVVEHRLPKEYDYHRMPGPWVQIKLLKILALLGRGDQKASEHCYTILEQALKRAEEVNNNISLAVSYQCLVTIASIYPNPVLQAEAAGVLGKYLESRSTNNMKYMGIQALSQLYRECPQLLEEYQLTIVDCLENKDETLKRSTLDLLYKMTHSQNVEVIVSKMLSTLHSSTDNHFRNALVLKITELAERHSNTHEWYLETMRILFELGSEYLSENVLNNFLRLVVEAYHHRAAFGGEIILKMQELLEKAVPTDLIIKSTCWVIGEIGASFYGQQPEKVSELCGLMLRVLEFNFAEESNKKWVIDAVVKLSCTASFNNHADVKAVLEKYSRHSNIELSQRALECRRLAKYNAALKQANQIVFEEDLPFLNAYVQQARLSGARAYGRLKVAEPRPATSGLLNIAPYMQKKPSVGFGFDHEEKKEIQTAMHFEPVHAAHPKKPIVSPEEIQKKALAKNLFGPSKGPTKTPNPLQPKPTEPKKKTPIETTNDLI